MVAGVIDWAPYVPQLFTHILWSFSVPVGTATAASPLGARAALPPLW